MYCMQWLFISIAISFVIFLDFFVLVWLSCALNGTACVLMYHRENRGADPRLLDTESKVVLFVKSVSNVKSFNHVFVFAQMKMDGRCEPGKRKVLQVNSGFYFAQFVQLLFSNIIREISCEVIYSLIY